MLLPKSSSPKVTLEEDSRGGQVFQIDRGDSMDALAVPATIREKVGVTIPDASGGADLELLKSIGYAVPTVHHNMRVLVLGTDYGESAGRWVRVRDVIQVLQQEAWLRENATTELIGLARAIARACGMDDERV